MRKERQAFSREFKVEAVRLLEEGKKPAAEVARELGVVQRFLKENVLYYLINWRKRMGIENLQSPLSI